MQHLVFCKYFFLVFFFSSFIALSSYAGLIIPVDLKWNGVEKWYADTLYRDVITFDNASYDPENYLPYFLYKIDVDSRFIYKPELKNIVYIPLTSDEKTFLEGIALPGEAEIATSISNARGDKTLNIHINPFIHKEDEILKLKSFELVVNKTRNNLQQTNTGSVHSYTDESVLFRGRFVKVQVKESGVYKLTYNELRNKGIDPSNVRMFGYGGAVLEEDFQKPKYDDLPEIAVYDTGDAILFYAQGINKWTYNELNKIYTHTINSYSNYGYYFITSDNVGVKKRMQQRNQLDTVTTTPVDITEYTDYRVHEMELVNLVKGGKEFYGEKFSQGAQLDVSFNFPDIVTDEPVKVRIEALSTSPASFHLTLNSIQRKSINITGDTSKNNNEAAKAKTETFNFNSPGENLNFNLSFNASVASATGYLNYIEINVLRKLIMNGSVMIFHNTRNVGHNLFNRYFLETSNTNIQIWDINDIINIEQIPMDLSNGKISFIDASSIPKSYIAVDVTSSLNIPSAVLLDEVSAQNIHGMQPVDMLIITHPLFVSAAEKLKQAHFENNGLKVGVVTTEQVYNEFSSGTPDATAYRWVAKMFYDRPESINDKLRYLLLFGKGSYDNRGLLQGSGEKYVLTYQADNSIDQVEAYSTDDYFGFLDDNEGKNIISVAGLDIGIGRFPVKTQAEAEAVVNKTIEYMKNKNKGGWKNQFCFIGDDDNEKDETNVHISGADEIAEAVAISYPGYHINKIYLDAYQQERNASGDSYPGATTRFHNLIRTGVFYINYMGHANASGWAGEQILTVNDIKKLKNTNLPLFTSGSCEFSRFDREGVSGGEELLLNPAGGGIGVLAATRLTYPGANTNIQKNFANILFSFNKKDNLTIGDAWMQAKNKSTKVVSRMSYVYFGDPAVKMNYPTEFQIITTEINGTPVSGNDILRALSVITVKGIIANDDGLKVNDFNGMLQAIILDKEQTVKTLGNKIWATPYEYKDRPNMLFKGKSEVINGEFEFTFMLPKDIRYNYGTGRFNFCAWDNENDREAQGFYEDFIVGGIADEIFNVETGPEAEIYLNHKNFVSGAKVNETPVFMSELYDEYGINIVNSTPGHAIMVSVDDRYWYELNDYYEAEQGSYKKGIINFQMPEMEEGRHSLTFRAWNMFNISTIKTLDFEVVKDLKPEIFSVSCYPNPATVETNIQIKHDREDEIIEMTIEVFDLSGRKVWTKTQDFPETIHWDLTTGDGYKLRSGMYVYRVSVRTKDKIISARSNKLIIKTP